MHEKWKINFKMVGRGHFILTPFLISSDSITIDKQSLELIGSTFILHGVGPYYRSDLSST